MWQFSEASFRSELSHLISPAAPIYRPEQLRGRAKYIKDIDKQFGNPGMHIFIHGERGVGKTSLAHSAVRSKLGLFADVPSIGCEPSATFDTLVIDIVNEIARTKTILKLNGANEKTTINFGILKHETDYGTQSVEIPSQIRSINHAVNLIEDACRLSPLKESIIIVDEFDRIRSRRVKEKFADFLKRLHDKRAPVRFIFCGVGLNIDELIGSHISSSRPIHPIPLEPLNPGALIEIVDSAAKALGFKINDNYKYRIVQISDGFPYYVHLITYHLCWAVFEHRNESTEVSIDDYRLALKSAIEAAEAPLKKSYNDAVKKTKHYFDYESILWAVAGGKHLIRQIRDIYDRSYVPLIRDQRNGVPLAYSDFCNRVYKLCDERHGRIIMRERLSWYRYRENLIRGYVRLVAENEGIKLGVDSLA